MQCGLTDTPSITRRQTHYYTLIWGFHCCASQAQMWRSRHQEILPQPWNPSLLTSPLGILEHPQSLGQGSQHGPMPGSHNLPVRPQVTLVIRAWARCALQEAACCPRADELMLKLPKASPADGVWCIDGSVGRKKEFADDQKRIFKN